uniref:Uncharacterized protein n=1 Tax=Anguilla anguilla TaxID=7936 RepID=A0A0E9SGE1_ANGAN
MVSDQGMILHLHKNRVIDMQVEDSTQVAVQHAIFGLFGVVAGEALGLHEWQVLRVARGAHQDRMLEHGTGELLK